MGLDPLRGGGRVRPAETAARLSEVRRVLREQTGLDIVTLRPARGGESGAVFCGVGRAGSVSVVKVWPEASGAADRLRALPTMTARLRERGYPAPRIHAVGQVPGLVFWVQERLPGAPLDPGPGPVAVARLLPELIRLNDAQAGLGTGPGGWPGLLTGTLTTGGDGYCVHSTLQARSYTGEVLAVVRRIGERWGPAVPAGRDFVHYDFTPANLLSDGSLRFHPDTPATRRHLRLARLVIADIES